MKIIMEVPDGEEIIINPNNNDFSCWCTLTYLISLLSGLTLNSITLSF